MSKVGSDERKPDLKKRKCKFGDSMKSKYPCFTAGRVETEAKCTICDCYVSVASRGALDLDRHLATSKHVTCFKGASSSRVVTSFFSPKFSKIDESVSAAEGALSFHTVRHHQTYRSMDCTSSLLPKLVEDSEIAKKLQCARTKTEAIVNKVLAPHSLECVLKSVENSPFLGIATDASNHGSVKLFPVMIQYFDWKIGVVSKIIDLCSCENETAKTIADVLLSVLKSHGLSDKCVSFCGDNANVNFGGINRPASGNNVFALLNNVLTNDLAGIGCPAHILHNTLQHGTDLLPVDIESIVLKIFNFFSIYTVRTEKLKQFCDFVNINYQQLLRHCKTRWLSLFPAIERILKLYPALRSYFLSESGVPRILKDFFKDEFSELYLSLVHSLMNVFHTTINDLEKEHNCLLDIVRIQNSVSKCLENRLQNKFMPMNISQKLDSLREDGLETEVNNFINSALCLYQSCKDYLDKWTVQCDEFECFYWLNMKYLKEKDCTFSDIIPSVKYINEKQKCIVLDDVILFDEFCALKEFVLKQDEAFFLESIDFQWSKFFEQAVNVKCFQSLLHICQFFFSIIAHNANVERVFSLINAQWSEERNRLSVESVKGIVTVQYNLKHFTCKEFHAYLLKSPELLKDISSSQKYC